jgi:hypothetical protein
MDDLRRFFRFRRRPCCSLSRASPRSLLHCPHLPAIDWGTQSLAPFLQPVRGCPVHLQFWCGFGDRALSFALARPLDQVARVPGLKGGLELSGRPVPPLLGLASLAGAAQGALELDLRLPVEFE